MTLIQDTNCDARLTGGKTRHGEFEVLTCAYPTFTSLQDDLPRGLRAFFKYPSVMSPDVPLVPGLPQLQLRVRKKKGENGGKYWVQVQCALRSGLG